MYNEKQKNKFIEEYTDNLRSRHTIRVTFNGFEPYERKWGEDLCMRPASDLEPIINSHSGIRMQSAPRIFFVVKQYVRWCKRQGIPASDGIFNVKTDVVDAMKEYMVATPEGLAKKLDKAFDDKNNETMNCLYKAYFWMAFAGLQSSEALEVMVADVDYQHLEIRFKNRIYQIYRESQDVFEAACTRDEFKWYHPNYISDVCKPRCPGDRLMRGIKADHMKLTTLRSFITKRSVASGVKLSYKKIYYSGVFYRALLREMSGETDLFKQEVDDIMSAKEYELSDNYTLTKIANKLTYELELDYDKWKCAFVI